MRGMYWLFSYFYPTISKGIFKEKETKNITVLSAIPHQLYSNALAAMGPEHGCKTATLRENFIKDDTIDYIYRTQNNSTKP